MNIIDDAFDKETMPKTTPSSAMIEVDTVFTSNRATPNEQLPGSMVSCAVMARAVAEMLTRHQHPSSTVIAALVVDVKNRRRIWVGSRSTVTVVPIIARETMGSRRPWGLAPPLHD